MTRSINMGREGCLPCKIALECEVSLYSERCPKSERRQGYSLWSLADLRPSLKGPIDYMLNQHGEGNSVVCHAK